MSGPKHTPTPARDAALDKAWVEHPELDNEERSAFICGFEAGWNAAAPHLAAELVELLARMTHTVRSLYQNTPPAGDDAEVLGLITAAEAVLARARSDER